MRQLTLELRRSTLNKALKMMDGDLTKRQSATERGGTLPHVAPRGPASFIHHLFRLPIVSETP